MSELRKPYPRTHGHTMHGRSTPTHYSWTAMRARCRYRDRDVARKHIGRGITVCDRWLSFENFLADMGERPPGTSLDRIDNNGNYEPGNCRWATPHTQARNRRNARLTFEQAVEACRLIMSGEKARVVAAKFGCSESLPREIARGRCWPDARLAALSALPAPPQADGAQG